MTQHSVLSQGGKEAGSMALTATVTLRTSAQTGEVMFTAVAQLQGGGVIGIDPQGFFYVETGNGTSTPTTTSP